MKVLVIGGAGYIGQHVVLSLLKAGHSVTVFDNFSSGLRSNLIKGAAFFYGNILLPADLDAVFTTKFDYVCHLAAFKAAGESMITPEKYSVNNITGSINILNAMAKAGCNNIIFSSSAAVYGEPKYLPIDEDHPLNPTNYYGYTKQSIEEIIKWYCKLRGMNAVLLRYFNAAGYDINGECRGLEQNPANLIPRIMEAALGLRQLKVFGTDYDTKDGTCIRDYIHVSDLAVAHVKALDYLTQNRGCITLNLGTNKGESVSSVIEATKRITKKDFPVEYTERRPGDPACLYASNALAKEVLGWQPLYSDIDTIIGSTWKVYLDKYEG